MLKRLVPLIRRDLSYKIEPCQIICMRQPNLSKSKWKIQLAEPKRNFHLDNYHLAKGKSIKKDKKKSSYIDEVELDEWLDKEKLYEDFNASIENFKKNLIEHTMLRTAQGSIENISFEWDGNTCTIQDVADISKKNPKLYVLDFSAFPQVIPTVIKTIQKSHFNLNIQQDGTKLFIPILKVTREHREVLAKKAKAYFVKCKDNIRDVQVKYSKKLKTAESISEETLLRVTNQIVTLADKHIATAEEIFKSKEEELLKNE